jgi:hypothetical protein
MKLFTIEYCGQCPAYRPDSSAYYDEYGICTRNMFVGEVSDDQEPPKDCPLKDYTCE